MLDGKNALKLSEDYIYFNLNLKIILSRLINYQKIIYTVPETFDILVSFARSDISVWHDIEGDKRIEIMS